MSQPSDTIGAGKIGFAIGTGRCGTKFIAKVLAFEDGVSSVHERNPDNEAFHRYCQWYDLPVDDAGFLDTKRSEIASDLKSNRYSFEASAHLSLSVAELYQRFGARFILLVRRPDAVVNSYLQKGWYDRPFVYGGNGTALGYQAGGSMHHFLGRIAPIEEFGSWNALTRVGKLAWYWNALNARVLEQFCAIPNDHWRVQKLEQLSYAAYKELAEFLGVASSMSKNTYDSIAKRRPNARYDLPTISDWSRDEIREFELHARPMAEKLDYEFEVGKLSPPPPKSRPSAASQNGKPTGSLRRLAARAIFKLARKLDPL